MGFNSRLFVVVFNRSPFLFSSSFLSSDNLSLSLSLLLLFSLTTHTHTLTHTLTQSGPLWRHLLAPEPCGQVCDERLLDHGLGGSRVPPLVRANSNPLVLQGETGWVTLGCTQMLSIFELGNIFLFLYILQS
jgi:hypothetical protein